jgi:hypothetical protein
VINPRAATTDAMLCGCAARAQVAATSTSFDVLDVRVDKGHN